MRRYNQRDEEGRFANRDNRESNYGRRYDDEDDDLHPASPRGQERYYMSRDGGVRDRDEEGRFMHNRDRYMRSNWDEREDSYYSPNRSNYNARYRDNEDSYYRSTARNSPYLSYGRDGSDRWVDTDNDGRYRYDSGSNSRFDRQHPRDDEGRFISSDADEEYSSRRGRSPSSRDEEDDDRGSNRSGRQSRSNLNRDEDGRFTGGSSNARTRTAVSSSSRKTASSSKSGPGRGWHGDSAGHAKAVSHSHDNNND